jgi:ATP-dependent DNA helicase RecQ
VRLGYTAGPAYTTKVLRGSREQRGLDRGHDKLSTWGLLAEYAETQIRDWVEQLVGQRYLVKVGEFGILEVTNEGREVLRGEETPRLLKPRVAGSSSKQVRIDATSWEGVDHGLFDALRALRKSIADERAVPAFVVFSDAALRDMARRRPTTPDGFLLVHGVGRTKSEDLGAQFVAAIRSHCAAHDLTTDVTPTRAAADPGRSEQRGKITANAREAFPLFERGCSVEEVATQLGRARSTTEGYLELYVRDRGITAPNPWIDSELFNRVRDAVGRVGDGALKPIFLHLKEEVPYNQIKVAIACMRNEKR